MNPGSIVSVKVSSSNGFAACYYVGKFDGSSTYGIMIKQPVRFIENFVPVDKSDARILRADQAQPQTVLEPIVQYVIELGMSRSEITIPLFQIVHAGEIENGNPELFERYQKVLEERIKAFERHKQGPQPLRPEN